MRMTDVRAVCLPFCLDRLADGRYVVLNREYKPVGFTTSDFVVYDDYPVAVRLKITPAKAAKLSWNGSRELARIYLYNDGCSPALGGSHARDYHARLSVLGAIALTV